MRKFSPQGGESDYEFHVEDEGELWELVKELERTEELENNENATNGIFCDICKKKFRSRYHLKLHKPVHTGEKNYNCGICKKGFQQKWNLITHMDRVHAKEKPFKCKECTKTFGYSSHFKRHIKTHFVEKMQVPQEIKRKILNPFSCEQCSKSFESNYRLKLHVEKHTNNELFVCDKCGLSFRTKTAISNHLTGHDKEDCKCDQCGKIFENSLSKLRHSRKVHKLPESTRANVTIMNFDELFPLQKKELIPCEVCGKTVMKESMTKHLNIHYRSRLYNCQYCGKEFLESSHRTVHERKHTGEKPYSCDFCGKRHAQHGNLLTHLMTSHKATKNLKPHTYSINDTVPMVTMPTAGIATVSATNIYNDLGVNNPVALACVEEVKNETFEESTQIPFTWINDRLAGIEHAEIKPEENPVSLPIYIPEPAETITVTGNVTNAEDDGDLRLQNSDRSFREACDLMKEVKKRMNMKIFGKIIEDLEATDDKAKVKFLLEDINNASNTEEKDPLKELLKKVKSVPGNNIFRRVDGKTRWFCWICDSMFANRHSLARHLIIHEPKQERPFKCEVCLKTFTQSNNYKEHVMSHNNENQFYCEKCGCGFRHKSHFNNHLKKHSETPSQEKPKRFQCLHCDKKFHTNFHRDEHMRTHTREKPYQCRACGSRFSALSTLNRHLEIHTNPRHQCQTCQRFFKQKSSLKRHESIHAENRAKRVKCECGKSFSQKSCLIKHKIVCKTRPEPASKPFACSLCDKKFLTRSDLKRHRGTHDERKKHKCDTCLVSLKSDETYSRHVRRHTESETGQ